MNLFRAFFAIFSAFVIVSLSSCGGGDSASKNPIVGSWTIVKAEGTAAASNQGVKYTFNDDGTATIGEGIMQSKYNYTIEGDILKMDYEGQGKIVLTWKYNIDGNKMTMENTTDATQKFEMEKK